MSVISNESNKGRIDWVDTLKFLGIFSIYLGHFGESSGKFYHFVFSYHVPLFFFMSGFFFKPQNSESFWNTLKKNFKRIMVPFFAFSFISVMVISISRNYDYSQTLSIFKQTFVAIRNSTPAPSLWFLPCLFNVKLMYFLLVKTVRSNKVALGVSLIANLYFNEILAYLGVKYLSVPFNVDSALLYMFYYSLGSILFDFIKEVNNLDTKRDYSIYSLLLVLTGVVTLIVYFKGAGFIPAFSSIARFQRLIRIFQTVILILFNSFLSRLLIQSNYLLSLGKSTLILCGFETVTKLIISSVLSLVGVSVVLDSPLSAIIYTFICISVAFKLFAEKFATIVPIVKGL